jgi:hypothetical protein
VSVHRRFSSLRSSREGMSPARRQSVVRVMSRAVGIDRDLAGAVPGRCAASVSPSCFCMATRTSLYDRASSRTCIVQWPSGAWCGPRGREIHPEVVRGTLCALVRSREDLACGFRTTLSGDPGMPGSGAAESPARHMPADPFDPTRRRSWQHGMTSRRPGRTRPNDGRRVEAVVDPRRHRSRAAHGDPRLDRMNLALPSAQHALGFTNADRQWIVTAGNGADARLRGGPARRRHHRPPVPRRRIHHQRPAQRRRGRWRLSRRTQPSGRLKNGAARWE